MTQTSETDPVATHSVECNIRFLKGADYATPRHATGMADADSEKAIISKIQESLAEAVNAKNAAFLLGSGCSSFMNNGEQMGIPTMKPLAQEFTSTEPDSEEKKKIFLTTEEKKSLKDSCGINVDGEPYNANLEALMEVLHSWKFSLGKSEQPSHITLLQTIETSISKLKLFLHKRCTEGAFSSANPDNSVQSFYNSFYRKLVYRDRSLPRPWVFTTNYDLFNEKAMDSLGLPYTNGFSGTIDRRFNPAVFRYALAEQLDLTSRKWAVVDGFVYLGKLHGSISWVDEAGNGLFPVREVQDTKDRHDALMVYPTPAKNASSLASPYTDIFREFQRQIVHEQSVLFVLGYSFSDEHINNIIYQALTIPTFRVIIFADPENLPSNELRKLKKLEDSRIWIIGGKDSLGNATHYFDYFVKNFMPQQPSEDIDRAIKKVMGTMISRGAVDDHG